MKVSVIIPALNEEKSIGAVLDAVPREYAQDVIVVDNGCTDHTVEVAEKHGAHVVREPERGYGAACLRGMASMSDSEIVVFLDGDYSDFPEEMPLLVQPIVRDEADLVIGSRVLGRREAGALPAHAAFGNRIAGALIHLSFGYRFTDLGPFRAIRRSTLDALKMVDRTYGWTVEMQVKAARRKARILEVPVSYRKRIGTSKISGTLMGSLRAGTKIIWTILKYGLT